MWHFAAGCKGRLRLLRGEALALHGQALWPGSCLPRAEDRTLYHLLATDGAAESGGRRGPVDPCPDDELVAHIQRLLEAPPFPGDGFAAGTHFAPVPLSYILTIASVISYRYREDC